MKLTPFAIAALKQHANRPSGVTPEHFDHETYRLGMEDGSRILAAYILTQVHEEPEPEAPDPDWEKESE